MGATEEAGDVAKSIVSSFGPANAACLATILLSAMFAILTYLALQRDADRRTQLTQAIITRCIAEVGSVAKEEKP
jgi:hypothetical protein